MNQIVAPFNRVPQSPMAERSPSVGIQLEEIINGESFDLKPIIAKVHDLSEEGFCNLATSTGKHWCGQVARVQSPCKSISQIGALLTCGTIIGFGILTSWASFVLLVGGDYSAVTSSSASVRVNFANNITNAGALFACVTDIPALLYYMGYRFALRRAHRQATYDLLSKRYYDAVVPQGHIEEFSKLHLAKLQKRGLPFYRNPDLRTRTGLLYEKLAPALREIDEEIRQGIPTCALLKRCIQRLHQQSCLMKLAKTATTVALLGTMGLAGFILLENAALVQGTPVNDLFSKDPLAQNAEAFYFTQLGGAVCSFTAFGASAWILSHLAFIQTTYRTMMCEKINACFDKYDNLPQDQRAALADIRDKKLEKWS